MIWSGGKTRAPVSSSSKIPPPINPDAHMVRSDRLDGVERVEALSVDKDGTPAVESGLDFILEVAPGASAHMILALSSCAILFQCQ
jgi:hypothetical protein